MDIGGGQTPFRVMFALIDHDFAQAERVLAASPREDFQDIDYSFYYPKAWFEAMIARAQGDSARADAAFSAARTILEQRLAVKPEDARTIAVLAQVGRRPRAQRIGDSRSAARRRFDASFQGHLRWRASA